MRKKSLRLFIPANERPSKEEASEKNEDMFEFPQQALWYSVITQAIQDSEKLRSKDKYTKHAAEQAITWLLINDDDYNAVCDLAGISPTKLRVNLWKWLHKKYKFALRDGRIVSPDIET